MAGPGYASSSNTFVPSHEASGNLMVGYSRNANKFAINRYSQVIPCKKSVGLYASWTSRNAARVSADGHEFLWKDGAVAPNGADNLESWQYLPFATQRYAPTFTLGNKAVEQADWPILALHAGMTAQQVMTLRTLKSTAALTTAAWGSHAKPVDDGTGTGGGALFASGTNLATGTALAPNIMIALNAAAIAINIDTLGTVTPSNLKVILNPNAARIMAQSPEIHAYVQQSQYALAQLRGDSPSQNGKWGLPDVLYGYEIEVEDAVQTSSRKGATDSLNYVFPDATMAIVSKVGELEGMEGSPSFTTLQGYMYEEMTVESKVDVDNRLTMGRVVTDFQYLVSSTLSGYFYTRLFG